MIRINVDKHFSRYESDGVCNVILSCESKGNDIFEDITTLFEKYSSQIIKIIVNNSLTNNLITEIHISVESSHIVELMDVIENLGYIES